VELGTAAVDKIFHTSVGYDLTEDQQKALKKFTEAKEKEDKERVQKQEQFAVKQAEQYKWLKGRGPGGYGQPYYYEGEQQYYVQQLGPSQQYMASGSGYGQYYSQPQMQQQQLQMQQQVPVRYQVPHGRVYYPPPQLVRGRH
jgi:hypothetical protein